MTKKCPFCHYCIVTEDWFYCCPGCGIESCPDCVGRCLCSWEEDPDEYRMEW